MFDLAPFEPVLTTDGMRAADRRTMEALGLPGRTLMETAGRAAVDAIEAHLGAARGRRVTVLCGKGNNGGDGLVVARVLHARGAHVRAVLVSDDDLTEDAAANLTPLRAVAEQSDRLEVVRHDALGAHDERAEWIVDGLLGIGVSGALRGPVAGLARWANGHPAPTVALDVPTGLDSDTGRAADDAIEAVLTVTMAAPKAGLLFRDGPRLAGTVVTANIGIPRFVLDDAVRAQQGAWRSTDAALRALLPTRAPDAHKYSAGAALVVAGSRAFPGAAVMASTAAARAGAGAVVCCTPASARPALLAHLVEVMTEGVAETEAGGLAPPAEDAVAARFERADAVLIGCGLGREDATQRLVRALARRRAGRPTVWDADALHALAADPDALADLSGGAWTLTPHLGELRALVGDDGYDPESRIAAARAWAERWNAVVLIKGMPSVVGAPDGRVFVAGLAETALATAGTGDVLAGLTAGLRAQGLGPAAAAVAALHWGGRAARHFAAGADGRTMLATDLFAHLAPALS